MVKPALDRFTTERLRAERLTEGHRSEVQRMHRDPLVMEHLGGVRDEAQTAAYMTRNLSHWVDHGFGLWILYERQGQEPIGRAVLRHLPVDGVDEVEVGYAFYPAYWGRGLASEVTRACLAVGREVLGLTTIIAVTTPSNAASQRVLVKTGLTFEREYLHEGVTHHLYRFTRNQHR